MIFFKKTMKKNTENTLLKKYVRFRLSIYGQVIYVITILSIVLFVSFGFIFRSVNEKYMQSVIKQSGNMVGSLVQGSLYRSMLKNDNEELQNTLVIINKMSNIDGIHIYDNNDSMVTSSLTNQSVNPNCKVCHTNINEMFPRKEKSYRVINLNSECEMNQKHYNSRHLLIRSPILNEKSCYTSECHVHKESEKVLGSIVIITPLEDIDAALERSSTDFFLLAALMTLILLLFLIFFTRKTIKNPLNAIIKASQAVANGNTNIRLDIKHRQLDDMKMVSYAFNNMLDNLNTATLELQNWSHQLEYKVQKKSEELSEAQNELIHIEKIASLGKLSASVAHEINNPLSGVLTYTKLIYKQLSKLDLDATIKGSMLKHLKVIETETKRCGDIVKGLLDFSKKDQQNFETKQLHEILKETYNLMAHQMEMANINFKTDFSARTDLIYCSENQIKQACVAIIVNASEAISENGEIIIKTINPDEDNIKLEITDNGSGISPEDIPHIFEPFFSAKHKESGIGLGLAIVFGIVQSHNGKIEVKSELGKGTTISIILPLIKN
ncbi:MAG: hypothetical protein COS14_14110 [Bacteroidetes bacterium CG02_land_8_20_14_3_00_31_25]|nr:MAG: hypothetical protein COS14_14110 [Bacteroidetes bacterium CG02_land_8_20_14_3_00_31_25]PIX35862.1 MAG: hypothetical protein COZ59_04160 [Bacteroidetes bacterium CG_4_8_14_3_um_filter_31_14]PIY02386.1 MAG: hypothetical protein COZ21_14440 [Bacteroidetes bacterium CG_4_10_14_3_um_filter_31_20]